MLAEMPGKELIARVGQKSERLREVAHEELPYLFLPAESAFLLVERTELESPMNGSLRCFLLRAYVGKAHPSRNGVPCFCHSRAVVRRSIAYAPFSLHFI